MLRAGESPRGMEGIYPLLIFHSRCIAGIPDDEIAAVAGTSGVRWCALLVFPDAGLRGKRCLDASWTKSCDRPSDSNCAPAGDDLWNSAGLGPSASCGFPFFRLCAEIFRYASRFDAVHPNQSCRLDHAVDEALRVLLACCDVA